MKLIQIVLIFKIRTYFGAMVLFFNNFFRKHFVKIFQLKLILNKNIVFNYIWTMISIYRNAIKLFDYPPFTVRNLF